MRIGKTAERIRQKAWKNLFAVREQEGNAIDSRIKPYNVDFTQPTLSAHRRIQIIQTDCSGEKAENSLDQAVWSQILKLFYQYHSDNFKDSIVHLFKKNKYLSLPFCRVLGIQQ